MPEIEILPWRRTQVLAARTHPSPSRPHDLEREGPGVGGVLLFGRERERHVPTPRPGGFVDQPEPSL